MDAAELIDRGHRMSIVRAAIRYGAVALVLITGIVAACGQQHPRFSLERLASGVYNVRASSEIDGSRLHYGGEYALAVGHINAGGPHPDRAAGYTIAVLDPHLSSVEASQIAAHRLVSASATLSHTYVVMERAEPSSASLFRTPRGMSEWEEVPVPSRDEMRAVVCGPDYCWVLGRTSITALMRAGESLRFPTSGVPRLSVPNPRVDENNSLLVAVDIRGVDGGVGHTDLLAVSALGGLFKLPTTFAKSSAMHTWFDEGIVTTLAVDYETRAGMTFEWNPGGLATPSHSMLQMSEDERIAALVSKEEYLAALGFDGDDKLVLCRLGSPLVSRYTRSYRGVADFVHLAVSRDSTVYLLE